MSIKHSKFKNTGLLFELLVRRVSSDTLEGKSKSEAVRLLRKYFVNTELAKEYRLYEQLTKRKQLSEPKAELVINSLVESSTKLNRTNIRNQRYNLVKEIKEHYDLDEFFKVRVPNYKIFAALNNLIENQSSTKVAPAAIIENKLTLLEHLTHVPLEDKKVSLLEEYSIHDKDLRVLTYKIMLKKFNEKYDGLEPQQKEVLREIVFSVDTPDKLKEIYNTRLKGVKAAIVKKTKTLQGDKPLQIKLLEVLKYMKPLEKTDKFTNDDIINLLQYYELVNEL